MVYLSRFLVFPRYSAKRIGVFVAIVPLADVDPLIGKTLRVCGLFMLSGFGMMVAAWQFRRLKRHSQSRFVNWIVRY